MTFKVGQVIECVNDAPDWYGRPMIVVKGVRYTVSGHYDDEGIRLAEVDPGSAPGWHVSRFRAIVERKAESCFTTGADPLTDQFGNRRKVRVSV